MARSCIPSLCAGLAVLVAAGCGGSAADAGTTVEGTGVLEVRALIGPTCPGPQHSGVVCTKPVRARVRVLRAGPQGAGIAARGTTSPARYRVTLDPGTYRVVVEQIGGRGGDTLAARITSGHVTR